MSKTATPRSLLIAGGLVALAALPAGANEGGAAAEGPRQVVSSTQPAPAPAHGLLESHRVRGKPPVDLEHAKASGAFDRIDSALSRLVLEQVTLEHADSLGLRVFDGQVQVHIRTDPASFASLTAWLEQRGATGISTALDIIQANVGLELLEQLDGHGDVRRVHRPAYAEPPPPPSPEAARLAKAGTYTSEALSALNAQAWHDQGQTGAGVKVGIIDSGFGTPDGAQYSQLYGTDLPPQERVHLNSFGQFGGDPYLSSAHGLGCAEVVTDVAPGVDMYLAAYAGTVVDLANAEQWMRSSGVEVISVSQNWMSWGPGDGSGDAADIANRFVDGGGVWVNSAANSRKAHYQSNWTDVSGNGWHEFSDEGWEVDPFVYLNEQTGQWEIFCITQDLIDRNGGKVSLFGALNWNQWGGTPTTNMQICVSEVDPQGSWIQDPYCEAGRGNVASVETFYYDIQTPGCYGLSVGLAGGQLTGNLQFEFFHRWDGDTMNWSVGDGSVHPPATASGAIAVAALDAVTMELESYSSAGPLNGPNGNISGGPVKPDVSGFANVSCHAYGPRDQTGGFGGTSAACPHIAGAAALVLGANPGYSNSQVRSYLESNVVDIGPGGKDNDYGHGRVRLGSPPAGCSAPGTPGNVRASATSVSSGQSYTISWSSASNADSYDIQEANNAGFSGATTSAVSGTSRSFQHSVSTTTTYYYRVRATRTCGSNSSWSSSASVTVTGGGGGGGDHVYWIPAAVHAAGQAGSQWRCDVGTLNRGSSASMVDFTLISSAGTWSGQSTAAVAAGGQSIFPDLIGQFQIGDQSGHLMIETDEPFTITARIYNQAAGGTFGQYMDGYVVADGLSSGQEAVLPQLVQSSDFRTNIGVANMGSSGATARITLYDFNGQQVGSFEMSVPAGQWRQDTEPFRRRFGRNDVAAGYAVVRVVSGSSVTAYASVVDNNTNDATTFPMKP